MAFVVDHKLLNKPNKEKYWISYIKGRIKKNKNFIGFISGETGSGKSWTALSICEQLDPNFNINQCVFGGFEFIRLINSGTLKRGSAICFEEAGVEQGNREWASKGNIFMNKLLQTFRHKNYILIMNAPTIKFVDSATIKLIHAKFTTLSINKKTDEVLLKPHRLQFNEDSGKTGKLYKHRLIVVSKNRKIKIDQWAVKKPSDKLLRAYENKKTKFTTELNEKIEKYFDEVENGKRKPLTEIQQKVLDLLKEGLTIPQIAKKQGKNTSGIGTCIRYIKKKGYEIKPIKKDAKIIKYEVFLK